MFVDGKNEQKLREHFQVLAALVNLTKDEAAAEVELVDRLGIRWSVRSHEHFQRNVLNRTSEQHGSVAQVGQR